MQRRGAFVGKNFSLNTVALLEGTKQVGEIGDNRCFLLLFKMTNRGKGLKANNRVEIYRLHHIHPMENESKDTLDIFFRRKPALMLIALKRMTRARYGSILAKEVDCTYSHAVKILQTLERLGLVVFEKKGRTKLIKLTKRGHEIAENIENVKRLLS